MARGSCARPGARGRPCRSSCEALTLGVRYCDTAPAYQQSQDYYGEAFRAAGAGARERIFLASKTHERTRDRALRLLDDQPAAAGHRLAGPLADARPARPGGARRAVRQGRRARGGGRAQADGRVRFIGLTGHHDPAILLEAMRRFPFDNVLVAINPADPRRLPFIPTVVAEARRRGMGVVGMKVLAAGALVREASAVELIRYAASLPTR